MQFPEVYTLSQANELCIFLKTRKVTKYFAGLEPDITDATFRFVATGYPIFRTPHTDTNNVNGKSYPLVVKMDDFFTKWLYGDDSKLYYADSRPNIQQDSQMGNFSYRDKVTDLAQIISPIICERKWSGEDLGYFPSNSGLIKGVSLISLDVQGKKISSE